MARKLASDSGNLAIAHEINVTPFIDVMLVLLITFMVAAPLATVDVKVELPVSTTQPAPRPDAPVYLTLQSGGTMMVNQTEVSLATLGQTVTRLTGEDRQPRLLRRLRRRTSRLRPIRACLIPPSLPTRRCA